MAIKIRDVFIIVFVIFALIIFFQVTNALKYIIDFFKAFTYQILLFVALAAIGVMVYFLLVKPRQKDEDSAMAAINFLRIWWFDTLGMTEEIMFQDSIMKEGYYDSEGGTEKFYGFNITKKVSNSRMLIIVGTKPLRVASFVNIPLKIGEREDPFDHFFKTPPTPVPNFKGGLPEFGESQQKMSEAFEGGKKGKWIGKKKPTGETAEEEEGG